MTTNPSANTSAIDECGIEILNEVLQLPQLCSSHLALDLDPWKVPCLPVPTAQTFVS